MLPVAPQAVTQIGTPFQFTSKHPPLVNGDLVAEAEFCVRRWGCWSQIFHQPDLRIWKIDFSPLSLIFLICKRLNDLLLGS